MRALCAVAALAVALVVTPTLADDIKSGPGDKIGGAFQVKAITGEKAGKSLCYVCQYNAEERPAVVLVFTQKADEDLAKMVKAVDEVQKTNAKGEVTFTTVFPGCYSGRWPHIHFEVYPSLADATKAQNRQRTSQLAFPKDACDDVYATSEYSSSVRNFKGMSLDTDNVFSDGHSLQLATVTGSVTTGYSASLRVPI